MKTILSRLKTIISRAQQSGGVLSYSKHVEIIHPDIAIPNISVSLLPSIFLVPVSSNEEWIASQAKISTNIIKAFLVINYMQRELSIMGDSTRSQGQGMMDFAEDFISVVRGHQLTVDGDPYLHKPLDIQGVEYMIQGLGENSFLMVGEVNMECVHYFLQTSLPADVS